MKYIVLRTLLFFSVILISGSCKKNLTVNFPLALNEEFTIPPSSPLGNLLNLVLPPKKNTWDQAMTNNDTRRDQLKDLFVKDFQLIITKPKTQTFRFLKSIDVFIQADGLTEQKLASKTNIPDDAHIIMLDLNNINLASFAKKDQFNLRVSYEQDEGNSTSIDMQAILNFNATAYLLK